MSSMTNEDPGWTPSRNSTRSTNRADRIRAVLDHGEMVELDGGTLVLVLQRQFAVMVVGDRGGGSGRRGPGVVGVAASLTR
jgi:hypothetical protein